MTWTLKRDGKAFTRTFATEVEAREAAVGIEARRARMFPADKPPTYTFESDEPPPVPVP